MNGSKLLLLSVVIFVKEPVFAKKTWFLRCNTWVLSNITKDSTFSLLLKILLRVTSAPCKNVNSELIQNFYIGLQKTGRKEGNGDIHEFAYHVANYCVSLSIFAV